MHPITTIAAGGLSRIGFESIAMRREPVVLKGLATAWPVVRAAKDGDRALCDYIGQRAVMQMQEILIAPPSAKGLFSYTDGLGGRNFDRRRVAIKGLLEHLLHLRAVIDAPAVYMQSTPAPLIVPEFAAENLNPLLERSIEPRLWIGNMTRVAAHFDVADNLAVVAAGRRRFILFPPEQVKNLYVGPIDFTPAGQPVSLVDPEAPDFSRFPLFREALASAQVAELEAGDAIYIPSPWWHYVAALSPVNLLVNYWWRDYPAECGTPFNWLVHGLLTVRHLPKAEREAWRSMIEHYVFEDNGDPAIHIPETAKSVLGRITPDLAAHLSNWLGKQFKPPPG
jgi:hypothetical protein